VSVNRLSANHPALDTPQLRFVLVRSGGPIGGRIAGVDFARIMDQCHDERLVKIDLQIEFLRQDQEAEGQVPAVLG
jgi:hypothetical protein